MSVCHDVWGKTLDTEHYPLLAHMLDTVVSADILWDNWLRPGLREVIAQQFNGESTAKKALLFAAGIHDIGKCGPIFQGQLVSSHSKTHSGKVHVLRDFGFEFPDLEKGYKGKSWARERVLHRHEKIGCWSINQEDITESQADSHWLDLVVLGHHGSYVLQYEYGSHSYLETIANWNGDRWESERSALIEAVESAVGIRREELNQLVSPEGIIVLSGLVILADRLASNERSVRESHERQLSGELSIDDPKAYVKARHEFLFDLARHEIGFHAPLNPDVVMGGFDPRGVQKVVPEHQGMWLVMAPTGSGKTEAALLRHCQSSENLTFLLPTQSTTNAMMGRLQKVYSEEGQSPTVATLAHGTAFLDEFYAHSKGVELDHEDGCGAGLIPTGFTNHGARLAAPVSVATIDQAVMAGLPVKWSHLRLLTLANAHVIIDEAHLIDHYQVQLVAPVLAFLGKTGTRVTVLSATMPTWLKNELELAYAGAGAGKAMFPSSVLIPDGTPQTDIETESYQADIIITRSEDLVREHVDWALNALDSEPDARVGVFVNTVDRCQQIALELHEKLPDAIVICLHSRMLAAHRRQALDRVLDLCGTKTGSGKRVILVGTQVIEMSLDIDLDLISTDSCPAPSLIQRMGRAWWDKSATCRWERIVQRPNMPIHIVVPGKGSKPNLPYGEAVCARTVAFLDKHPVLSFPQDVQAFVETSSPRQDEEVEDFTDAELDELSQQAYEVMRGNGAKSRLREDILRDGARVSDFASLTCSSMSEDTATRLIDWESTPFVMVSPEPELQVLGALEPGIDQTKLDGIDRKKLHAARVSLSRPMERLLKDEPKLTLPAGLSGFFGELPEGLTYNLLVGLRNAE